MVSKVKCNSQFGRQSHCGRLKSQSQQGRLKQGRLIKRKYEKYTSNDPGYDTTAIKDMNITVSAMSEAAGPTKRNYGSCHTKCEHFVSIVSKYSQQTQKQPILNWKAQDKNNDLLNFEMVVKTYS